PPQHTCLSLHDALPIYAGRKPIRSRALRPSATHKNRRYLRNDAGASAICATHESDVTLCAIGCGIGIAKRPASLITVDRGNTPRSEEHPSELQSLAYLV